jgi:hypothetical protein
MADPVTLAMVGAAAGAAMKPKDPLRGAMLGATVGYTGGTALGVGGAASGAAAGSGAAATGGASAATNSMIAAQSAQPAMSYAGGNILNAANAANTANATNLAAMNSAGMSFSGRPPIDPSMLNTTSAANTAANTAPSFMDKIGMAGKNAYENPMMTSQALSATNSLLAPDPQAQIPSAPTVPIQAGRPLKPNDFVAAMNPYQESVIGNSQFSLI